MNLTPEMILRGYQANTAALEEMIFVKGKVAIVTGGTSGLGFCVARRLCQGGAKVVLASSTQEKGDLAVRLLKEEGFDVIFYFFRAEAAVAQVNQIFDGVFRAGKDNQVGIFDLLRGLGIAHLHAGLKR